MIPELLYEIYKYLNKEDYIKLKDVEERQLSYLVEAFRGVYEARLLCQLGQKDWSLLRGMKYIARTNPKWSGNNISEAAERGYIDIVKSLLNERLTVPKTFSIENVHYDILNSALMRASNKKYENIVILLLNTGYNFSSKYLNFTLNSIVRNNLLNVFDHIFNFKSGNWICAKDILATAGSAGTFNTIKYIISIEQFNSRYAIGRIILYAFKRTRFDLLKLLLPHVGEIIDISSTLIDIFKEIIDKDWLYQRHMATFLCGHPLFNPLKLYGKYLKKYLRYATPEQVKYLLLARESETSFACMEDDRTFKVVVLKMLTSLIKSDYKIETF